MGYHPERIKSMLLGGATLGMDLKTTALLHGGNILKYIMPYMWIYSFFAWIMMPKKNHCRSRRIFVREARKLGGKEFRKWYRLLMQFPLYQLEFERPGLLEIPKLFISGSQDHLFLSQVISWMDRDPNAALHIIKNQGHLCNIEAPEEFNRVCLQYVQAGSSKASVGSGIEIVKEDRGAEDGIEYTRPKKRAATG